MYKRQKLLPCVCTSSTARKVGYVTSLQLTINYADGGNFPPNSSFTPRALLYLYVTWAYVYCVSQYALLNTTHTSLPGNPRSNASAESALSEIVLFLQALQSAWCYMVLPRAAKRHILRSIFLTNQIVNESVKMSIELASYQSCRDQICWCVFCRVLWDRRLRRRACTSSAVVCKHNKSIQASRLSSAVHSANHHHHRHHHHDLFWLLLSQMQLLVSVCLVQLSSSCVLSELLCGQLSVS